MSMSSLVVAFRIEPVGLQSDSDDSYLARARSVCARCELQGGRLVAWSDGSFAIGWPSERLEDLVGLLDKLCASELAQGPLWAIGLAEGELDLLAPDGSAGHLAWGKALVGAVAMARAARLGEVVMHEDFRACREGRLSIAGERTTMLGRRRVRGWRLDMDDPWPRPVDGDDSGDRATLPYVQPQPLESPRHPSLAVRAELADATDQLAEAPDSGASEVLAELRGKRIGVQGGSLPARCRASLALAMGLMQAGRCEDALFEALDALARGREADDPAAVAACMALLAKVYDMAGARASAVALGDVALGR